MTRERKEREWVDKIDSEFDLIYRDFTGGIRITMSLVLLSMIKYVSLGLILLLRNLGNGLCVANNFSVCLSSQIGMSWDCISFDDYYVTC